MSELWVLCYYTSTRVSYQITLSIHRHHTDVHLGYMRGYIHIPPQWRSSGLYGGGGICIYPPQWRSFGLYEGVYTYTPSMTFIWVIWGVYTYTPLNDVHLVIWEGGGIYIYPINDVHLGYMGDIYIYPPQWRSFGLYGGYIHIPPSIHQSPRLN